MELTELITCCDAVCIAQTRRKAKVQARDVTMWQVRVVENGCTGKMARCSFAIDFSCVLTRTAGEVDGDVKRRTCSFWISINYRPIGQCNITDCNLQVTEFGQMQIYRNAPATTTGVGPTGISPRRTSSFFRSLSYVQVDCTKTSH